MDASDFCWDILVRGSYSKDSRNFGGLLGLHRTYNGYDRDLGVDLKASGNPNR